MDSRDPPDDDIDESQGERRAYYDRLIQGEGADWDELMRQDPEARKELEMLALLDGVRSAHARSARRIEEIIGGPPPPAQAPADRSRHDVSGKRLGRYRLGACLGKGGFAIVYRAREETTGREVALKVLRERNDPRKPNVARFIREARALQRIVHENIVRVHEIVEIGDLLALAMEIIEGKTLRQIVSEEGPLAVREAVRIAVDLCRALGAVHGAGFVHRDVKAENVVRDPTGRIVLMDFGITRPVSRDERVTVTGILVGTPVVMAPEQLEMKPLDARTDIYALGSLLYFLLTGSYPVHGRTLDEVRRQTLSSERRAVRDVRPHVPASVSAIVGRAMAREPGDRFPGAGAMEEALAAWLAEGQD
jgi:eukaryotic-like serine/threonine-protein kinase